MKKILFAIIIHLGLLGVLKFTAWPENLLWPYFNFSGLNYYKDIFILYPPFYWLSLGEFYKLFGLSIFSLKLFTYLVIVITDILIFCIAKKKLFPVLVYIPLQIFFEGNGIWVDQLLAPIFLGIYFALQNKKYFILGGLMSLAILTKQTAIYFFIPVTLWLLIHEKSSKRYSKIILGGAFPIILTIIYLINTGSFWSFYDSTINYILTFHSKYALQTQWPNFSQGIITVLVFFPSLISLFIPKTRFMATLSIFAALGIFSRFEYFHLQPALPLVAIVISSQIMSLVIYFIFLIFFLKFFVRNFSDETRFFEQTTLKKAQVINNYIIPGDHTLFINTWDQYYLLTDTLPVGNVFIPTAPWTLDYPGNQEKLKNALLENRPKYIVYNSCFSIKNNCYEPKLLSEYVKSNYQEVLKLSDGSGIFEYNPVSAR